MPPRELTTEQLLQHIYDMPSGSKITWRKFCIEYEGFDHTECAIECAASLELHTERNCPDIFIDYGPSMDDTIDYCDNEFIVYHTDITQISITTRIDDKHKQNLTITRDGYANFSETANGNGRRHEVKIFDFTSFPVIDILEKFIDTHESETVNDEYHSVLIEYEKGTGNKFKKEYNLNSNYKTISDRIRRLLPLYNLYLMDGQNFKEPVLRDDDICFVYQIIEKDEPDIKNISYFGNNNYTFSQNGNTKYLLEEDYKEIAGIIYNDIYLLGDLNKDIEENSDYGFYDHFIIRMVFQFDGKETIYDCDSLLDYFYATEKMERYCNALKAINVILEKYNVELTDFIE
ncbi:MAG: hypothetical protein ACI4WM_05455 [Erysipelotrichaceae bacterium]